MVVKSAWYEIVDRLSVGAHRYLVSSIGVGQSVFYLLVDSLHYLRRELLFREFGVGGNSDVSAVVAHDTRLKC